MRSWKSDRPLYSQFVFWMQNVVCFWALSHLLYVLCSTKSTTEQYRLQLILVMLAMFAKCHSHVYSMILQTIIPLQCKRSWLMEMSCTKAICKIIKWQIKKPFPPYGWKYQANSLFLQRYYSKMMQKTVQLCGVLAIICIHIIIFSCMQLYIME